MSISFIVPTIGRSSLARTLHSIRTQQDPDDEILVVGDGPAIQRVAEAHGGRFIACPRGQDWGATERQAGIRAATRAYLAFMDDDDIYLAGARAAMAQSIAAAPHRPTLFRMVYAEHGLVLWYHPAILEGNVSTQMMLLPNDVTRLGRWGTRYEGDLDFLRSSTWADQDFVWRPEVIACIRPS